MIHWTSQKPTTITFCFYLIFSILWVDKYVSSQANRVTARTNDIKADCEKKFQECLDKPADIVSRKYFQSPRECNHQLERKGCIPIELSKVERQPSKTGQVRWRLLSRGNTRQIPSLLGVADDDPNDPGARPTRKPMDHRNGGIQISSDNLHDIIDLDKSSFLT